MVVVIWYKLNFLLPVPMYVNGSLLYSLSLIIRMSMLTLVKSDSFKIAACRHLESNTKNSPLSKVTISVLSSQNCLILSNLFQIA